ncbi:MAG: hypothetical protein JO332_17160 [Planctomycetaceae bacterium]|nr:hypothetical protein [Planctomycetaceae bacterium]
MPGANQSNIDKVKWDIKACLERVRGAIKMKVPPKDQGFLLDAVDRIAEEVMGSLKPDASKLQGSFIRSKDQTRKSLRQRPADMVQILNEIDGLSDEITRLLQEIGK